MSEPSEKKSTPFDQLTPEQRERGRLLLSEVSVEKVTLSFSIEGCDVEGRKKSAFYSVSASRDSGKGTAGFSVEETQMIHTFLSRHVVQATYDDAFRRKILSHSADNIRERDAIVAAYDDKLVHLLAKSPGKFSE